MGRNRGRRFDSPVFEFAIIARYVVIMLWGVLNMMQASIATCCQIANSLHIVMYGAVSWKSELKSARAWHTELKGQASGCGSR